MRNAAIQNARILFVDDHPVYLEGLVALIGNLPNAVRVQTCETTSDVEGILRQRPFDVVFLDIVVPGRCPFELAKKIVGGNLAKVIFLSAFFNETNIRRALHAGAAGLISKIDSNQELLNCLAKVLAGEKVTSAQLAAKFSMRELMLASNVQESVAAKLTKREVEILTYIADAYSTKEIAKIFHLNKRTVDRHRSNIMEKTGLHDRVKLARFALKEGFSSL